MLTDEECSAAHMGSRENDIDYGALYNERFRLLRLAFGRITPDMRLSVEKFASDEEWLEDYALFMALKDAHGGASFQEWEDELRLRDPHAAHPAI